MPDRADTTWTQMVRRHAEVAASIEHDDVEPGGFPPHQPTAAVLACSDARVPPSVLFGQEPGALFVVRLAGNSATPGAIASLTYAVEHLGVDLVIVLGHTGCGAIAAALDSDTPAVFAPILTPIDEMLHACETCDDPTAAVVANVRHNAERLRRDRGPLGRAVRESVVAVRGAVHDLSTGNLIPIDTEPLADPTGIMTTTPSTPPSHQSTPTSTSRRAS